jgi:hypothetical protein
MAKDFSKKYMHPTRRKLVNMVMSGGEYETNRTISFSKEKEEIKRSIGDVWEDTDGSIWEQKEFGKIKKSKLTDTMSNVREYLSSLNRCKGEVCEKNGKYGPTDKKLITKTGYCSFCLVSKESNIKKDGLWEDYETYRITTNMISHGREILSQLNQAYTDAKQEYEYVNEDGSVEKWTMERNVDELKADILLDITNGEDEINNLIIQRDKAWVKLDGNHYGLLKPPTNE